MKNTTKLICGNCLQKMKRIQKHTIDLIIADLPYSTTNNKWDTIIPFKPMWEQIQKVTKENACILLFGQQPFTTLLNASNLEMFKYEIIWDKGHGVNFLNAHKQPLRSFENISVFYKKQPVYNPQKRTGFKPYQTKRKGFTKSESNSYMWYKECIIKSDDGTRYPVNIIKFGLDHKKYHPTQKPVKLLKYLISTYTNENDTVLDFCMGVGSTGIACKYTNRNFIGIELNKEYFDIAKKRINKQLITKTDKIKKSKIYKTLF